MHKGKLTLSVIVHYKRDLSSILDTREILPSLDNDSSSQQRRVSSHPLLQRQKLIDIPLRPNKLASQERGFRTGEPDGEVARKVHC